MCSNRHLRYIYTEDSIGDSMATLQQTICGHVTKAYLLDSSVVVDFGGMTGLPSNGGFPEISSDTRFARSCIMSFKVTS
jgi:hypothetical protein